MSAEQQRGDVAIDLALGYDAAPRPVGEVPFCMLVIGDFGGRAARAPLAGRRAIAFDRDDVDAAIARVSPALQVTAGSGSTVIRFASLEDFHPDRLFATLPLFAAVRELRARLLDPRTFAAAARELSGGGDSPAAEASGGSLLDRMLDEAAGPLATTSSPGLTDDSPAPADDLATFIRQAVRQHLVAEPDPRQAELVRSMDAAVATQLRALLHDPTFQALESGWRTVERLARRVDTSTSLRLYLLDVAAAELDAALDDTPDGSSGAFARVLADVGASLPGGASWSCLVVLRRLGDDEWDHARLARLGLIARNLAAPAFIDASPGLVGLATWAALPNPREWAPADTPTLAALRASSAAAWLSAAAPRVLLRAPYGADGEPIESFAFEELDVVNQHEDFLWGSAGAVCALLLAQAFAEHGWSLRLGGVAELDGLPLYVQQLPDGSELVPLAETLLTEVAAERLLDLGITPIATMRGTDTVRVVRFQSVTSPPTSVAGPWQQ